MTIFSIFDRSDDLEPRVVPDRFSWLAALLPPVYAVVHGLWLALAGWIVAVAGLVLAAPWLGEDATVWLYVVLAIFIGFEAATLRRVRLTRKGFAWRAERIAPDSDSALVAWLSRDR